MENGTQAPYDWQRAFRGHRDEWSCSGDNSNEERYAVLGMLDALSIGLVELRAEVAKLREQGVPAEAIR
jgi:hypothetical protein